MYAALDGGRLGVESAKTTYQLEDKEDRDPQSNQDDKLMDDVCSDNGEVPAEADVDHDERIEGHGDSEVETCDRFHG